MIYGYARVSTDAQDLTSKVAQLKAAGCARVFFREKISGATARAQAAIELRRSFSGATNDEAQTRAFAQTRSRLEAAAPNRWASAGKDGCERSQTRFRDLLNA
jgi:hypothetical protein